MISQSKKLEIFCGTGGVGKTTLSTSRAIHLALQGKKILLITIDPAKRLKDILSLEESQAGEVQKISKEFLKGRQVETFSLDALLISPAKTLHRLIQMQNTKGEISNRILQILFKPYGGMNEIMSLLEVQFHLNSEKYDCVILDTPPGKHFIEFLESCNKVQSFFDKSFIEIFHFIKNGQSDKSSLPFGNIFKKFISTGIRKLLGYLEKMTGQVFVSEFLEALSIIYRLKDPFLKTIQFQSKLKDSLFSTWYLVTSIEHDKITEALNLSKTAQPFLHQDSFMIINKCLKEYWTEWDKNPQSNSEGDSKLFKDHLEILKKSFIYKEEKIKNFAKINFPNILEFREVLSSSSYDQVMELVDQWGRE